MLTCAFFGHRELLLPDIPQKLDAALSLLLARDTAFCFLVGGTGEFDAMAAQAVRRAKGFVRGALSTGLDLGQGSGPLDHMWCHGKPHLPYSA